MSTLRKNDKLFVPLIAVLSVAVPAIVAALIFIDKPKMPVNGFVDFLPTLNGIINSTVSVLLVLGLIFIRRKQLRLHKAVMMTAFVLSVLFLLSYVTYHYAHGDVKYGGEGALRTIYLLVLASHIILSIAVVPLALFSIYRGLSSQNEKHKRIVRWTWPIWLYVSITGVFVYLMVHVYNPGLS